MCVKEDFPTSDEIPNVRTPSTPATRAQDGGSHLREAMVASVAVLPRISPAAVSPPLRRGAVLTPLVDPLTAAGYCGVSPRLAARTLGECCRRHAIPNKPNAVAAATALQQGVDAVTSGGSVKVSVDCDVDRSRRLPVIHLPARAPLTDDGDDDNSFFDVDGTSQRVSKIKAMLKSMGDGEISISAYDTAWVALVPDKRGNGGPQFPSCLRWIEDNQLPDGSWGDLDVFIAYDRLLNTLACVIALKSWDVCPDRRQRGISFLRENMHRLEGEDADHMPIGFEVAFPSLIEIARSLDLEVPYEAPALQNIYNKRELKLKRIPKDMVHKVATTLLHSLEGMLGLEWKKLLELQCADGSFLFSPASTAFALIQTGDGKCLGYLEKTVQKFNGGVPNVYPVDLFEHLWSVDRLERLGISRYFQEEIRQCLDYVHKHWTDVGICWARNSKVQDVDDTSMGFRLLRLHGYDVSPEVFRNFEKAGEFFCFAGQSNQAITGIYNLNRASQVCFPGEKILREARIFSHRFLREKQARNELADKWIITKDLPGEVGYALDFPWYASLPRVETRLYMEQYGGDLDVWIGKTLYRMRYVNNDDYLELAKSDFNRCQALHQLEWLGLQRWYGECGLKWYGVSRRSLLRSYFLAAASIFEPERAAERLGWARTAVIAEAMSVLRRSGGNGDSCVVDDMRRALCADNDTSAASRMLSSAVATRNDERSKNGPSGPGRKRTGRGLVRALLHTLDLISLDAAASLPPSGAQAAATQRQIRQYLRRAWEDWLRTWSGEVEEDSHMKWWWPGGGENDETGLLLVRSLELCTGRTGLEQSLQADPPHCPQQQRQEQRPRQYAHLTRLISSLIRKLRHRHHHNLLTAEAQRSDRVNSKESGDAAAVACQDIEPEMEELIECVLRIRSPDGGSRSTLQTFLTVAKSFYYIANCSPATLEHHIAKVLFEETV